MKPVFMIAFFLLPCMSVAMENSTGKKTSAIVALSSDVRRLLSQEMQALQRGMIDIVPAYVSGDFEKITEIASRMKNSYILKSKLTKPQRHELHTVLPADFIKQDKHFHYLAGMLAHVAKNKKVELINFYIAEMNKACMACHSEYAVHKFPAFVQTNMQIQH